MAMHAVVILVLGLEEELLTSESKQRKQNEDIAGSLRSHLSTSDTSESKIPSTTSTDSHSHTNHHKSSFNHHDHTKKSTRRSATNDTFDLPPIPMDILWSDYHPNNHIVAFYNIYIGRGSTYSHIVDEQLDLLNMTGLLQRIDVVYYVTIGKHFNTINKDLQQRLQISTPLYDLHMLSKQANNISSVSTITTITTSNNSSEHRYRQLKRSSSPPTITNPLHSSYSNNTARLLHLHNSVSPVDETLTLSYLYLFCSQHPQSIVLYFHDKGSYHYNTNNVYFRNFLDCYVLNPNCLNALEDLSSNFDTCGWRFSPVPNTHYSGNYWWAKCSYVNKLVHPGSMAFNNTFVAVTNSLSHGIVSSRRFLPEAWIGSGPRIQPADCMGNSIDQATFLCCYDLDNIAIHQCPNHAKHFIPNKDDMGGIKYEDLSKRIRQRFQQLVANDKKKLLPIGSTCQAADIMMYPTTYLYSYERARAYHEHRFRSDLVPEMIKRSILWYGQLPETYLNATKHLAIVNATSLFPHPSIKVILVEPNTKTTYLYDNGTIYDRSSRWYRDIVNKNDDIPRIHLANYKIKLLLEMQRNNKKLEY